MFLIDYDRWTAQVLAERERLLELGVRLVQHNQTPNRELQLTDAITGDHLFTGPLEEGLQLFDTENWADVDTVDGAIPQDNTVAPDVPEALQEVVRDWADSNVEEARAFAEM